MEAGLNLILAVASTLAWTSNDPLCGTASVKRSDYYIFDASEEVAPVRWPWNAAIHTSSSFRPEQYCGAALFTDQHVLTAAHCVDEVSTDAMRVHLGSWRRSLLDDGEIAVPVKEICVHRNYSGTGNDIAIIKMAYPVNFTRTIRPVCLPERKGQFPTDSEAFATGWTVIKRKETERSKRVLRELKMKLMNEHRCARYFDVSLPEEVLCAGHDYGSLCEGDSGAPLMQNVAGQWFLQGVLSGGPFNCGDKAFPMVFTRVASFVQSFINPYLRSKTYNRKAQVCRFT
ncbi:chymotrypsin-like elastase family member 2A [Amblyomma americanum]